MKILITGFTGVQCNASAGQLDLISNIASLWGALIDLGHDVEWRPVVPGEPLEEYERCIVSINGTASWVSPYALGGLYVMGARKDTILTMDDWQAHKAFSSANVDKELAVVWNEKLNRANHFDAIENPVAKKAIDEAVEELCYLHYRKLLIPAFAGGDLSILELGAHNAIKYDPSPYMLDRYEYAPDMPKARMWVSAGLAAKESWFNRQKFTWDVEFYGIRKLGQSRVKESMLASIYSERWGILSPPHPHAGSGWFRVRFMMAALAGAVIYCDDREGKSIGHPYVGNSLEFIESLNDERLAALSACQKAHLLSIFWDKPTLCEFVNRLVVESGSPPHGTKLFEIEKAPLGEGIDMTVSVGGVSVGTE